MMCPLSAVDDVCIVSMLLAVLRSQRIFCGSCVTMDCHVPCCLLSVHSELFCVVE